MKKFDYTHEQELFLNPHTETFKQYIEILEKFDPINDPPEKEEKQQYIINFIVPILQEYARDFGAILEVIEKKDSVTINIITEAFMIITEETDFKAIISYTTSFAIERVDDKIKIELYFFTNDKQEKESQ